MTLFKSFYVAEEPGAPSLAGALQVPDLKEQRSRLFKEQGEDLSLVMLPGVNPAASLPAMAAKPSSSLIPRHQIPFWSRSIRREPTLSIFNSAPKQSEQEPLSLAGGTDGRDHRIMEWVGMDA